MKNTFWMFIVLPLLVLSACTAGTTPAKPEVKIPTSKEARSPQVAGWEQKWNQIVAEGKKEGVVSIYVTSFLGAELRSALATAFKNKYGIDSQFTPMPGQQMAAKINTEQRAGLFLADAFATGATSLLVTIKPENLLGPIEPMLVLPEVLDPKAWEGGELFNFDKKDRSIITMLRVINRSVVYNKDLVKPEEIDSYKDFLKPQFKGKITMTDPTLTGPGGWFATHLADVYGFEQGMAFLKELITRQEVAIQRDGRMHIETVARGKHSVGLGGGTQFIADFLALGAPIAIKVPKEGDGGGPSFGAIAVPPRLAHPNAATVFINWLLTQEGQSLYARGSGNPSRRLDASTEGVHPIFLPMPGEKVAWDTVDFTLGQARVMEAARAIVGQVAK